MRSECTQICNVRYLDGEQQSCLVIASGIVLSHDQQSGENYHSQTDDLLTDSQAERVLRDINWITMFRLD